MGGGLMSVEQTIPVLPLFTDGTVVGLYDGKGYNAWPPVPPGPPLSTGTVTNGAVTFTGLEENHPYFAAAEVGEPPRWQAKRFVPFSRDPDPWHTRGPEGPPGPAGPEGKGILGEEAVETKHLKAFSVTAEKLAPQAVTAGKIANGEVGASAIAETAIGEKHLAAALKTKVNQPTTLITAQGVVEAGLAAGSNYFWLTGGITAAAPGTVNTRIGVFLKPGIKYKAHLFVGGGAVLPGISFTLKLARVLGMEGSTANYSLAGPFTVVGPTAKVTGATRSVEVEAEFEVGSAAFYLLQVVTTEATAASSTTGVFASITN